MPPGCGEDLEHRHRLIMQSQLGSLEIRGFCSRQSRTKTSSGLDKTATHTKIGNGLGKEPSAVYLADIGKALASVSRAMHGRGNA